MPITRPSEELKNKININPVGTRTQEATAEDFIEIAAILEEIGITVDDLTNATSANPYYGRFSSLAILQATHTAAEEFAWAIIETSLGVSPQIALWNNTGNTWEISGATADRVFVAKDNALPSTGEANKWYITLDKNKLWYYNNNQWQLISGATNTPVALTQKHLMVPETDGQTQFLVPGNPSAIIVIKNGVHLIEGALLQYSYNNATYQFTLKKAAVKNETFTDGFEVIALGVGATKQMVIADVDGQTEFNFTGNPTTLLVYVNGVYQQELQFTRTFFNTNNKTIFTKPKPIGTIVEFIKLQ